MKKTVFEKSFVIVLFILVMIAFAFAERDTQKLFEKYNTKSTVQTVEKAVEVTAGIADKAQNKSARD